MNTEKIISFKEGCKLLGYRKSYVYKLTSAKILPFYKPNGGKIFFDRDKLEEWLVSNRKNISSHQAGPHDQ